MIMRIVADRRFILIIRFGRGVASFLSSRWLHRSNWGIINFPMLNVFHVITLATFICHFVFFVEFAIIIPVMTRAASE
jgi:hypothetical protein